LGNVVVKNPSVGKAIVASPPERAEENDGKRRPERKHAGGRQQGHTRPVRLKKRGEK